jgi:hypothetical protein
MEDARPKLNGAAGVPLSGRSIDLIKNLGYSKSKRPPSLSLPVYGGSHRPPFPLFEDYFWCPKKEAQTLQLERGRKTTNMPRAENEVLARGGLLVSDKKLGKGKWRRARAELYSAGNAQFFLSLCYEKEGEGESASLEEEEQLRVFRCVAGSASPQAREIRGQNHAFRVSLEPVGDPPKQEKQQNDSESDSQSRSDDGPPASPRVRPTSLAAESAESLQEVRLLSFFLSIF